MDAHPVIGNSWMCPACHRAFGAVNSFDDHQQHHPRGHPAWGCFTGVCLDPAGLGLVADDQGTWQTGAGLARRERARGLAPGKHW